MAGELSAASRHPRAHRPGRGPRWRLVTGTALVTAAAAMVLVAHRTAQQPPRHRWLVVGAEVAEGTPLTRDHLAAAAIDLPDGVEAVPLAHVDTMIGRVAAHHLDEGQLLTGSDLLEANRYGDGTGVEVSVTLDHERAPTGALHPGDTVDVLATDPDGSGTRLLVTAARVVDVDGTGDDGIGLGGGDPIRLAVADVDSAAVLVDAAVRERLTVVLPAPGASAAVADRGATAAGGGRR